LLLTPISIWFYTKKKQYLSNVLYVLHGKKSWIGYLSKKETSKNLPPIKNGILNPGDLYSEMKFDFEKQYQLNMLYAKDYSILSDAEILLKGLKYLDR
jgi:hypothetical protein